MLKEKFCLHCNLSIKGRTDKKFCDDQCRSAYHQAHTKGNTGLIRKVHKALKKNRQILIDMNPSRKTKVLRKDLLSRGFDFGYFTSILETGPNSHYYFCYEMGYLPINKDHILLVIKEDHERMEARR